MRFCPCFILHEFKLQIARAVKISSVLTFRDAFFMIMLR